MRKMNLQQEASATDHGIVKNVKQNINLSLEEKKIYFDLKVVEVAPGSDPRVTEQGETRTLIPSRSYQIRVSATRNGDLEHYRYPLQRHIFVESDIKLQIACVANPEIQTILHIEKKLLVKKDSASKFKDAFPFTLPAECPVGDVELNLLYEETGGAEKPATIFKVTLDGTYLPADTELGRQAAVNMNESFQDHVATLYVERPDFNKLYIRGWNRRYKKRLSFDASGWEPLNVADLIQAEPKVARNKVIDKSSVHLDQLLNWLKDLLKKNSEQQNSEQLCVVISDRHDLAIPWEIVSLDGYQDHLGTRATVVRWRAKSDLNVIDEHHHGSVIAYLDDMEQPAPVLYHERSLLKEHKAKEYQNLKDLESGLLNLQSLDGIGLIYLACYGHEHLDSEARQNLSKRLAGLDFDFLSKYDDPRPIIFVNAYGSANPQYHRALMDVLLSRLASSYIGTLGPIGPAYACKVAKRLLQAAFTQENGIRFAEVLRDLRAEAVKEMWEIKSVHEDFIYAFMYVYYGNPLMCLRLIDPGELEAKP